MEWAAGLLIVAVLVAWLVRLSSRVRERADSVVPAPVPDAEPVAIPATASDDPERAWLRRLYATRGRFASQVSRPEDLVLDAAFRELVSMFLEPEIEPGIVVEFFQGEDGILAWAAVRSLAFRPHDPDIEELLLARLNSFHHWTRGFMLRALEAWHPDDPNLLPRVLARLDATWNENHCGPVLDAFVRRRLARAPLTAENLAVTLPASRVARIQQIVHRHVNHPSVEALALAFGWPAVERDEDGDPVFPGSMRSLMTGDDSQPGKRWEPGTYTAEDALGHPTADVLLHAAHAALTAESRRSALVVGDTGVGKTALVRRIAARLSSEGWTIVETSASQLNAGMSFVGQLEQRLREHIGRLSQPKTLWIVPDFHQLVWTGRAQQNPTGALEQLLPAIGSGEILVLGETRIEGLERVVLEQPEVRRVFEVFRMASPPEAEVAELVDAWASRTAEQRQVETPADVRREAVALARQYLPAQPPPGGVLRLLDGAVAEARKRETAGVVTVEIADAVAALSALSGLPHEILDERRTLNLDEVRARFESRVIGQTEAVRLLADRLALLKAGVTDPNRPTGVFLFAGPSGTGKTEMAKTLADYLFGSPERLIRLDMSELQDPSAVERVVGSPQTWTPGKSLAELVRRQPFSVVLLDEFEKAHPRVWDLFLQVFDDGRLTDARGEAADFRQSIIIVTSNLGAVTSGEPRLGLVGSGEEFSEAGIARAVERAFRPELRNRFDRVVVFRPLTREVMRGIIRKELRDAFARRGLRRRDWAVELEESAIELLVERGFSPTLGARPLRRAIEELLLTPLAAAIAERRAPEGDQFLFVRADGDQLAVEFVDPDAGTRAMEVRAFMRLSPGPTPLPGLATIALEGTGAPHEVEALRAHLAELAVRVESDEWQETKSALLRETAADGFWERGDRYERLGRAEYLDRIDHGMQSAASLLERLEGSPSKPRDAYPRDVVRRLAQQLFLLERAARHALAEGPRDVFLSIEPLHEDAATPGPAREFAGELAGMYARWAKMRGMRWFGLSALTPADGAPGRFVHAIAGFAAWAFLADEDGLHVLEIEDAAPGEARRVTVRVHVVPQPTDPPRDGLDGLARQAREALSRPSATATRVVRRYRAGASPLVRDAVHGWRTGRIDRVLAGDFDLISARE
jgi:ATP-dependent Clp protease ATP-binding subunit ClpC